MNSKPLSPLHGFAAAVRTRAVLLLALPLLAVTVPAAAGEPIGQIIAIEGTAQARDAKGTLRVLHLNAPVFIGDEIATLQGSKVQVFLLDDTTLSQGENSILVLDEYVYDPQREEDGAVIRFVRGVFRSVTGRITEVNPDRFKIRTGKAVIGVRGCDLMFEITEQSESMYVVELPSGRFILVDITVPGARDRYRAVRRSGRVVHVRGDGRYSERNFRAQTINNLINATTPAAPQQGLPQLGWIDETLPPDDDGEEDAPDDGEEDAAVNGEEADHADGEQEDPVDGEEADIADGEDDVPYAGEPDADMDDIDNPDRIADAFEDDVQPEPELDMPAEDEPAPSAPATDDPPPSERIKRRVAQGTNWEWGYWDEPAGSAQDVYFSGRYLSSSSVYDILEGSTMYNLHGEGMAGAVLTMPDSARREMQGIVDIYVNLGGGITPDWSASFSLSGSGSQLDFNAGGSITAENHLQGQAGTYSLNVDGTGYGAGTLTENRVGGNLVGPDPDAPGINGVVGDFLFRHGASGPRIDGAYGADLQQLD